VDFDFYGHQLVVHLDPDHRPKVHRNPVDGHAVPVPHFGVVLGMDQWKMLRERLVDEKVEFIIEPYVRFEGEVGEQATMFFSDPAGNHIEIKAFNDLGQLFAV
jgi:extradiol dioxygenase family protein